MKNIEPSSVRGHGNKHTPRTREAFLALAHRPRFQHRRRAYLMGWKMRAAHMFAHRMWIYLAKRRPSKQALSGSLSQLWRQSHGPGLPDAGQRILRGVSGMLI